MTGIAHTPLRFRALPPVADDAKGEGTSGVAVRSAKQLQHFPKGIAGVERRLLGKDFGRAGGRARAGRIKLVNHRCFGGTFTHPDPIIGPGVQQIERQHTAAQHLVVKAADVEFRA